jgi:hypothetical protein
LEIMRIMPQARGIRLLRSRAWLLALVLAGCGDGSGGVQVSGTINLDGNPLETGFITFLPEGSGRAATANITGGAYRIPSREGATPGTYRIEIHSFRATGQVAKQPIDLDYSAQASTDIIAFRYNRDTELRAVVTADGPNVFDLSLTSRTSPKDQPGQHGKLRRRR